MILKKKKNNLPSQAKTMKIFQFLECIVFCSFHFFDKEDINYVKNCQDVDNRIHQLIELF